MVLPEWALLAAEGWGGILEQRPKVLEQVVACIPACCRQEVVAG